MRDNETVKELVMTAGAVRSSLDAEVFSQGHAFQKSLKLAVVPKSCFEAITGHARR